MRRVWREVVKEGRDREVVKEGRDREVVKEGGCGGRL